MRFTRWAASRSAQIGSIRALLRAHSRVVSTSSADITQVGWRRNSVEPGEMPNRAPRAPR